MRTTIIAAALATTCLCAPALAQSNVSQGQGQQSQPGQMQLNQSTTTNPATSNSNATSSGTTGQSTPEPHARPAQPDAAAGQGDAGSKMGGNSATSSSASEGSSSSSAADKSSSGSASAVAAPTSEPQAKSGSGEGQGKVHYVTNNNPNLWSAKKLDGVHIYNDQNKDIGSITDVLVDRNGQVKAVVIGVGGFLGIGEHDVAVSFNSLQWQMSKNNGSASQTTGSTANGNNKGAENRDAPAKAILPGATQQTLKKAPEFKYAH